MPMGGEDNYHLGANIVIGGLAVLVFYFALFIIVATVFHLRLARSPTTLSQKTPQKWLHDLRILYITSALIFIRSIFRLVEYAGGNNGWLMRREWTLYVFDTILMWFVLVLFNFWPPPPKFKENVASGIGYQESYHQMEAQPSDEHSLASLGNKGHGWTANENELRRGAVQSQSQV